MTIPLLTRHVVARMRQRAFRHDDLDLILMIGTSVDDGYMVLDRDADEAERAFKYWLGRVRKLRGKRIVVANGRVVTAYRATEAAGRRLVRRLEDREFET